MTLCLLSKVLDSCDAPVWESNNRIRLTVKKDATVSLSDLIAQKGAEVYTSQISDPSRQSQFDKNETGDLPTGLSFILTLPRNIRKTVVARNLADLISIDSATWQTPPTYFLVEEEETKKPFCFIGDVTTAPHKVKNYHRAIEFWELVAAKAEYTTATRSLLFFGADRLELKPGFKLNDLTSEIKLDEVKQFQTSEISPEILKLLRSKLDDSTGIDLDEVKQFLDKQSRDIRTQIFRSVLSEILRDQPAEEAFACLLRSSSLFAQRLNEAWKIYISTFSPQKLNDQAVAKHLELTEKLEKIIGGMEVKSLTIPAAVLLAVKEVQFGGRWTTLNTIILAASVLYLLAMTVAHFSQRSTLKLLKTTIEKTTKDLKAQGLAESNAVLKDSFVNLENRRTNSARGSWAMFIFSLIPLIAVAYAAFLAEPKPEKPSAPTGYVSSKVDFT